MGRIFGSTTKTSSGGRIFGGSGGSISGVTTPKTDLQSVEGLQEYATSQGLNVPKQEAKTSTLQKILDILNTGAYATGGLISGKGIKTGVKEKILPSEALGIKNKLGGLATDILLDPTTYLTFGYGSGAKVATQAGAKVLNKAGTKLLKKAVTQFGEESGRKMVANALLREGGEKYLAKGGLKFLGAQILPRKAVTAPVKAVDKLMEVMPVTGKIYKASKEPLAKAFVPFSEIKALPGQMGEKYVDKYSQFAKGTRTEVEEAVKLSSTLGKKAQKAIGKKAGEITTQAIETGQKTGNKIIDQIIDFINRQHKTFLEAEKGRELIESEMPDYLRHFLTKDGKSFLEKGGATITSELSKPLRVRTPFAQTRSLQGTIKEINAYFKKFHGVKLFEEDAFKAFAARKSEHIKAIRTYDFLTDVGREFGKPAQVVNKTVTNPVTGKTYIKEVAKPFYHAGVDYAESSVPQLKGVLLPKPIVKHVDDTYQFLTNEETTKHFLKLYDKTLAFWKGSVTGWFPSFHSRNFMGGMFNNWLAGVKTPMRYIQANDVANGKTGSITTKLGTKYSYKEIKDMAVKMGATGQPGYLDVMKEVEKDLQKGIASKFFDIPKNTMEFVEDRLRLPLFIDRLIKGDTPEEATKWVFRFHFDYAPEGLTTFEKDVMRRLIPFYRWTRGNMPLQIEQIIKQPGKYAGIGKAVKKLSGDENKEEMKFLPEYMQEGLPIRLPGKTKGMPEYIYGLGLPLEDLNKLSRGSFQRTAEGLLSEISPLLKYPIEATTGRNLFFGRPIEEVNWVYPFVDKIPGLKQWLEVKSFPKAGGGQTFRANPYKMHFLNTMLGRLYVTAGKTTDERMTAITKALYGLMGVKIREVDIEKEKFWRDREFRDKLERLLESEGLLKTYSRPYVPKQ